MLKFAASVTEKSSPLLVIAFFLTISSCQQTNFKSYDGYKFEVDYLHTKNFDENDWIQIDSIRFNHIRDIKTYSEDPTGIPTSKVDQDSIGAANQFEGSFSSLTIGITLGRKLNKIINQTDSTTTQKKSRLMIANHSLLMTHGRLQILKTDSSSFTIKTSKNYPAKVKKLELN